MSNDSLLTHYFDGHVSYMKNGNIKEYTLYSACYKGNITKIYVVKPVKYYTVSVPFTIDWE